MIPGGNFGPGQDRSENIMIVQQKSDKDKLSTSDALSASDDADVEADIKLSGGTHEKKADKANQKYLQEIAFPTDGGGMTWSSPIAKDDALLQLETAAADRSSLNGCLILV